MKVLLLNTSDKGGAGIATDRLFNSLKNSGLNCQYWVQDKLSQDENILHIHNGKYNFLERISPGIDKSFTYFYSKKKYCHFSTGFYGKKSIVKEINNLNPDIVHLNWVKGGMLSISQIARIKAPIVWTLHDMWVFTGGCHYDEECGRYEISCGKCKVLNSNNSFDLSKLVLDRKRKYIQSRNINFVGVSSWIENLARKSSLLNKSNIYKIGNPIDTNLFSIKDKNISRNIFDFSLEKKLVLYGAYAAVEDVRKGFNVLIKSLEYLIE